MLITTKQYVQAGSQIQCAYLPNRHCGCSKILNLSNKRRKAMQLHYIFSQTFPIFYKLVADTLYVHRKVESLATTEISKCLFFIIAAWYNFCHPNVLLNFVSFCVIARIQNLILEKYFFPPYYTCFSPSYEDKKWLGTCSRRCFSIISYREGLLT